MVDTWGKKPRGSCETRAASTYTRIDTALKPKMATDYGPSVSCELHSASNPTTSLSKTFVISSAVNFPVRQTHRLSNSPSFEPAPIVLPLGLERRKDSLTLPERDLFSQDTLSARLGEIYRRHGATSFCISALDAPSFHIVEIKPDEQSSSFFGGGATTTVLTHAMKLIRCTQYSRPM